MRTIALTGLLLAVSFLVVANEEASAFLFDILDAIHVRTHHEDLYDKYLDVPGVRSRFKRTPLHDSIRDALSKLPLRDDSSAESILAMLEGAHESEKQNEELGKIYEQLLSLTNEDDSSCPVELLDVIKSVQAQARAKRTPFQQFEPFMVQYGRRKLELCSMAISVAPGFEGEQTVVALEELFRAAHTLGAGVSHLQMFEALSKTNLITSHLDVHEMSRVAEEHVGADMPALKQQPLTLIREFLGRKCGELNERMGNSLDIINLARALGSPQRHQARLLEINELRRLCLMWQKDKAFRIIDSFHAQLDAMAPVLRPAPSDGQM